MTPDLLIMVALGLCFGSLNTLLIHRLPEGKPVGATRSACPACGATLRARDLVPLLSWLATRGRCRHCRARVHWRYPVTEVVTAALFALAGWIGGGLYPHSLLLALLASQMVVLCVIDLEHRIIPDELQISLGVTGILYGLATSMHPVTMITGALVGGGIGLLLQQGYKKLRHQDGLGTGDVKFMTVSGIWLGTGPLLPYLFYAGVLGVISAMLWRLVSRDPRFPFGPALALSLLVLVAYPPSAQWFMAVPVWIATMLINNEPLPQAL